MNPERVHAVWSLRSAPTLTKCLDLVPRSQRCSPRCAWCTRGTPLGRESQARAKVLQPPTRAGPGGTTSKTRVASQRDAFPLGLSKCLTRPPGREGAPQGAPRRRVECHLVGCHRGAPCPVTASSNMTPPGYPLGRARRRIRIVPAKLPRRITQPIRSQKPRGKLRSPRRDHSYAPICGDPGAAPNAPAPPISDTVGENAPKTPQRYTAGSAT